MMRAQAKLIRRWELDPLEVLRDGRVDIGAGADPGTPARPAVVFSVQHFPDGRRGC